MTKKPMVIGLGGVGLSLALSAASPAQEGQTPAESAVDQQAIAVEPVELDALDEEREVVVVVQANAQDQAQEEMLRQIIKDLVSEGFTEEDAREMLGLDRQVVDNQPAVEASGEVVQASPDGAALYLPLGTTRTLAVEAGATLEMPFVADGPGILTVAYSGQGRVGLEVLNPEGHEIEAQATRSRGRGATTTNVAHGLVAIGTAGDYTIRLTSGVEGDLKFGAEWIPFPRMGPIAVIPVPDPDTELTIVPDRMVVGSIDKAAPETEHLWCRYDAEADGQLVVLANASQGDITVQSFQADRYQHPMEYRDDDLNGSVANEGMILDVRAGESYYVRVDMRSGQRCEVEVRAGLIPLPEEE